MTRMWKASVALVLIALAGLAATAGAAEMSLDEAFTQMKTYKFGQSRLALTAVSDAVRDSATNPAARKALATRLAKALADKAFTTDAKRFVCRKLSLIGTDAEVPTIATFLLDKDLCDMARYALERIPGEAALAALRAAVAKADGKTKIGIVNSLGERRDAKSTDALIALLGAGDGVGEAAAAALGKIAGAKACKALAAARAKASAKAKPALTNALLMCANAQAAAGEKAAAAAVFEKLYAPSEPKRVRIAALQGLVTARGAAAVPTVLAALKGNDAQMRAIAASHVRTMKGKGVAKAFAEALAGLNAEGKIVVLAALGERADQAAAGATAALAEDANAEVQAAALQALATLGDAGSAGALVKGLTSKDGGVRSAAQFSLRRVAGKGTDEAIVKTLDGADPATQAEIIKALSDRKATAATGALLKAAQSTDGRVRSEAIKALGEVADEAALGDMVGLVTKLSSTDQTALAKSIAIVARGVKDEDKRVAAVLAALKGADASAKAALLGVLGRIGSPKALGVLKDALGDASAEVKEAAVRGLGLWPDEGACALLLQVAKSADNLTIKVIALRGYVDVVGRVSDANKKVKLLADAMPAASRTQEKQMILGAVAGAKTGRAVTLLTKYLDDPALKQAAAAGIFRLAGDKRWSRRVKEFKPARAKIMKVFADNKNILKKAQSLPK